MKRKPNTKGPGAHSHDEDDVFFVIEGTRAGVLNFSCPGNFEQSMPAIAEWFAKHPPQDAR